MRRYRIPLRSAERARPWLVVLAAVVVLFCLFALPAAASAESLCTDTWSGPAEGEWSTVADWSAGHVPGSSDVACIGAEKTVRVTGGTNLAGVVQGKGSLIVVGGTLEVSNTLEASNLSSLTVEGGTLTGAATIDVSSSFAWSGGYMSGSGSTVVQSGASGSMSSATDRLLVKRLLVNEGSFSLTNGELRMSQGAEIKNSGTFVANSQYSSEPIEFSPEEGATPLILNTGSFEKTGGSGTTGIAVAFENHGTVQTTEGSFEFLGGGSTNSEAKWTIAAGDTATFARAAFTFKGGTSTGTLLIGDTATMEGTTTFEKLTLSKTLTGPGVARVSGTLAWTGGTMSGSGSTVILPGATITTSANTDWLLIGRTVVNEGTWSFTEGEIRMSQGAVIKNSGTFIANSQYSSPEIWFSPEEGTSPGIVNTGVFEKTAGSGSTTISVNFENLGTLKELEGKLVIRYPVSAKEASTQYGGAENPSTPGQPHSSCGKPVSCASGNESESQTDFAIGGRGVGLSMTRYYNSQAAAEGAKGTFGYGWTSSFSDHLSVNKTSKVATLYQANGSTVLFAEGTGGAFTAPVWTQDTLSGTPEAGYTLTLASQIRYKFAGSSGRLESVTDRNGNATTMTYNEAGRLEAITDPTSRKITFAYNGEGLVESAKDPMGHTVKYVYEEGNLKSVTQPAEVALRWQFKYDGSHQLTELTDGRGGKTSNEYNGAHQVTYQKDPAGHELSFEYEAFHTKITNKTTGAVTDERFTSNYEPYSITHGYGTASATTETFAYNEGGYLTSTTDGNSHTTKYGYNGANDRTSMVDPDSNETKWTYDATHDVETITTPKGETTTIKRDVHGNPEVIERPAPGGKTQKTTYKYTAHGEL